MLSYSRQSISDNDIKAVVEVLKSDYLTQGALVERFEQKLCDYTGSIYSTVVNSGTSALHIACLALGLTKGDWLWTSTITFVASANCGLYCGAKIDFVDIDPHTWNISISAFKAKLEWAEARGVLPKIVVFVHLAGLSCDMRAIKKLAYKYKFKVIEDACHALGGEYENRKIGSCIYSDATVFSFHAIKSITTGEGGAVVTNSEEVYRKMKLLSSHGITRNPNQMTHQSEDPWYYEQIDLGYNYRMTDFQAALGMSQLERLDSFILKRNKISHRYDQNFDNISLNINIQSQGQNCLSARHLYVVRLDSKQSNKNIRNKFFKEMRGLKIGVNLNYIPIHLHPFYRKFGFKKGDFPESELYYKEAVSLPVYQDLSEKNTTLVIDSVKKILL